MHAFNGGLELRLSNISKASAIEEVMQRAGKESVVAFLGDDLTDEDAFAALDGRGLTVLVRPEYRETRAQVWLKPPGEMLAFLTRWKQIAT